MQKPPTWDLTDLFSSIHDPKIDQLTNVTMQRTKIFREKYHGRIGELATPSNMLEVIKEYESILSDFVLPQVYGELIFSVDSASSENGAFLQKVRSEAAEIFSQLIFVELEITNLSEQQLMLLMESEIIFEYRHFFEKLADWKINRLSEAEEQIVEMKDLTGRRAFVRLFEQELAGQKFKVEITGEKKHLSQSEILNLLHTSESQDVRKRAAEAFTAGLHEKESVLVFIMNILAEDKKISDKLHKFSFPDQSRHKTNEAKPEAVEAMASVVEKHYNLVQQYYDFKKEVLGLEKIYDYDRYAPLEKIDQAYTFVQAKEIVLDAFKSFDENFGKIAEVFFEKSWIDAAPGKGKRGGAFCEGATPTMHPFVFMNFTGSANDVMTLAHELGHAINFELSRKQTFVNYGQPLTLAETASIFAETLVFKKMVESIKDKKVLLGLYMQKIESIFASTSRQISMYRFEQDFHNNYRERGEMSAGEIGKLWRDRQGKMFGESLILTGGYDNWWMYVAHFIHTPFYVYAYAFGELLAFGLFEKAKEDRGEFAKKYIEFLEAAGSKSPQELADLFEIDLEDESFWESGMRTVEQYLIKAKELHSND